MANKKKLPVSIFELVWYPICALVIIWGLTYVVLGLVGKYNNISSLDDFNASFKKAFGLSLYFWGLIIIAIGVVAGVAVMLFYAKIFDRASEREQRRSARLNALKKDESKVVDEQKAEVVEEKAEEVETPKEEAKAEEAPANEVTEEEKPQ